MEEMVFVGYQFGTFQPDGKSERLKFQSIFMLQSFPVVGADSDFHFEGMKSAKYKLASVDVLTESGVGFFDVCEVYFSSKGVVTKLVPTGKNLLDSMAAARSEEELGA